MTTRLVYSNNLSLDSQRTGNYRKLSDGPALRPAVPISGHGVFSLSWGSKKRYRACLAPASGLMVQLSGGLLLSGAWNLDAIISTTDLSLILRRAVRGRSWRDNRLQKKKIVMWSGWSQIIDTGHKSNLAEYTKRWLAVCIAVTKPFANIRFVRFSTSPIYSYILPSRI